MQRSDINPWEWSKGFGFSQAIELRDFEKVLFCSGQTATDGDGAPPSTSDMTEQVGIAMNNLSTVLAGAGMTLADVVKLKIYTTDMDELLGAFASATELLGANLPAMTVIGVARLAFPELKVEIEATAAR
jgi:enamine deaminase RidA (YjgF/YER057c/UK114 family)